MKANRGLRQRNDVQAAMRTFPLLMCLLLWPATAQDPQPSAPPPELVAKAEAGDAVEKQENR